MHRWGLPFIWQKDTFKPNDATKDLCRYAKINWDPTIKLNPATCMFVPSDDYYVIQSIGDDVLINAKFTVDGLDVDQVNDIYWTLNGANRTFARDYRVKLNDWIQVYVCARKIMPRPSCTR